MDRNERINEQAVAILSALTGLQAGIWTAIQAVVESFDPEALTIAAQPATMARVTGADGSAADVALPLLVDVPVVFPTGGPFTITQPIAQGDECLVVFASRCIDNWWQAGGVQAQAELRMHDLSDGFAICGPFSRPRAGTLEGGASATDLQVRTLDGGTYISLHPEGGGKYRARVQADDVELYGKTSLSVSIQGLGWRYTWEGSNNFTYSTWGLDGSAVITDDPHAFHPPDIPEGT